MAAPTRPTPLEAMGLVLLVLALIPIIVDIVIRRRPYSLRTLFLLVFSIGLFGTLVISDESICQAIGIMGAIAICGVMLRNMNRADNDG